MQKLNALLQPKIIRSHETDILCEQETGGMLWVKRQDIKSKGTTQQIDNGDCHWFFLEEGTVEFQIGSDSYLLQTHDCIFIPGSIASAIAHGNGCAIHGTFKAGSGHFASDQSLRVMRKSEAQCFEIGSSAAWVFTASQSLWAGIIETPSLHDPPPATPPHKDKLFLVLAGRYEFQIGDARVQLETGDAAWAPHGTLHQFRVVSAAPGQVLAIAV